MFSVFNETFVADSSDYKWGFIVHMPDINYLVSFKKFMFFKDR